jgi:hypothetical protein
MPGVMGFWEHFVAARPGFAMPLWRACQVRLNGWKDSSSEKNNESELRREREKEFLTMNDRRGNVYENKGPLWKTVWKSGNVVENKGIYESKAGMLLKRQVVSRSQVVGGGRTEANLRLLAVLVGGM